MFGANPPNHRTKHNRRSPCAAPPEALPPTKEQSQKGRQIISPGFSPGCKGDPQIAPAAMTLSPIRVTHCKIEKISRGCPTLTVEQPLLYILNGSALYPCVRFSVLSFVNSKNLMCIYKKANFMANKRLNFFNSSPGESKEWFPLQYNFVSIKDIDLFAAKKRIIP